MSDREIRNLLRLLNEAPGQCTVTYQHLKGGVYRAEVLTDLDRSLEQRGGPKAVPHPFYFVQTGAGRFVGAVNDGGNDLHWYIESRYRGKGLMSNALREVILPDIAAKGRGQQTITISRGIGRRNFEASLNLALAVGFQLISDPEGDALLLELVF